MTPNFAIAADEHWVNYKTILNAKPKNLPGFVGAEVNAESKTNSLIFTTLDLILLVAGTLSVVFIVVAGVRIVASVGGKDEITNAKRNLQWAILGLIAIILSWALIQNVVYKLFTKYETPGEYCRGVGCACTDDSDCDSKNCDDEPLLPPKGVSNICQPAEY